jgi:hypothetical protein
MKHKGFGRATSVAVGLVLVTATGTAAVAATINRFSSELRDYNTAASGPFDDASARLQLVDSRAGTTAVLHVRGVDPAVAGRTFGAHLHDGPCVADGASLSRGHYNHDVHAGASHPTVSRDTEIWLDVTIDSSGAGDAASAVRFPVSGAARSIVIHERATDEHTGLAGARLACLPVVW